MQKKTDQDQSSVRLADDEVYALGAKPPRKVCIVGGGKSRWEAPFHDDTWECWGLNDMQMDGVVWDRWFALHTLEHFENHYTLGWIYQKIMMRKLHVPIYVWEEFVDVPGCRIYPKEEVEALTSWGRYHCGSFDWMVALAILEGFEEIRICGVNLMESQEPISSRACLEYWIGVAEGRGITVDVRRTGSALMSNFYLVRTENRYGPDEFHLCVDDNGEVVW